MNIHEHIDKWHSVDGVSFFHKLNLPPDSVCFDFGSGYGEYATALALAYPDSTVYAIDKNRKMNKVMEEKKVAYQTANIHIRCCDLTQRTAFDDNCADLILMYDFIHGNDGNTKLPLRFAFFAEARRMLKPGGILSIAPFECAYLRAADGKRR